MRRIVMFTWLTADGYFAGPTGDLDWVVPDEEQARMAAKDISGFDAVLFGRRTYEMFEAFWAHAVVDDSGAVPDPHHAGRRSPEHGAIAIALNKMNKFVFSRTLTAVTWRNSRLLRELDPGEIKTMKGQPGKDLMIFGSGSVVSQLTEQGLIDEYQFVVCPIFLGSGLRLLSGVSKRLRLDLLEAKSMKMAGEGHSIRAARAGEAQLLSDLALRSKAHWRYPPEFIEACRDELSYAEGQMRSGHMRFFVIEGAGAVIGFSALTRQSRTEIELEALFVEPAFIGMGFGRLLIEHAKSVAAGLGATQLIIQGDPNAEHFYLAAGGVLTGTKESESIPGRFLPTFAVNLTGDNAA